MRLVQVLTFPAALPGLLSAGLRGLARVVDRSRPSRVGMVAIALVVALYLRRVRRAHLRLPVGADGESRSTLALARRCPTLFKHYFPFLLDNGTLQTMMAFLVRPLFLWLPKPTRHELVTTMDGGTLGLAWFEAPTLPSDAPLLIILPGNLGGYDAPYIRRMLYECRRIGWRVVVWQRRGADGLLLRCGPRAVRHAHGGMWHSRAPACPAATTSRSTMPMRTAILISFCKRSSGARWLLPANPAPSWLTVCRSQYPLAPLLGLGYSLGANYLARHLAQAGQRAEKLGQARRARRGAAAPVPPCTPFLAGVCVANPFELVQGSYYLFYYSPIADWFLRTDLKLMVTRNKQQLERAVDLPTVMRSRSYRDMCAHFHQVVNGWEEVRAHPFAHAAHCSAHCSRMPTRPPPTSSWTPCWTRRAPAACCATCARRCCASTRPMTPACTPPLFPTTSLVGTRTWHWQSRVAEVRAGRHCLHAVARAHAPCPRPQDITHTLAGTPSPPAGAIE